LDLHVFQVPELLLDNTDRNRTSPFAFTGNRFEFRALGSSANSASSMIVINAAVACQLMEFKENVDNRIAEGMSKEEAIFTEVRKILIDSKPIHFDGNGYSDEWKVEAARRGLDCENSAPLMYDNYLSQQTIEMFKKTGVMTHSELLARNEVKWELYTKKIQIEARVLGDLVMNHIVPVATRYQSILIDNVFKIKNLFPAEKVEAIAAQDMAEIEKIALHMLTIKEKANAMVEARKVANLIEDERAKAIAYRETVEPYMEEIRYHVDKLELMIDNEIWPLPKYRELLFIK
jgi:glutamine synthetase